MCDHSPNRASAEILIEGTPVPGVTTRRGSCDPCIHPLVQALNDGGLTTVASCCGHGHRPISVLFADHSSLGILAGRELLVLDDHWPSRRQG